MHQPAGQPLSQPATLATVAAQHRSLWHSVG